MVALPPHAAEDPALSLTSAVIVSSPSPLLLLDADLCVIAASTSFCDAFGIDAATVRGGHLVALGAGEWNVPLLRDLLASVASGTPEVVIFEMELTRPDLVSRCLIINIRRIAFEALDAPRLLIAVADVTDARADERAKDAVIERLNVELREIRHRVANSLQIVSSILLQAARRTNSLETRDNLTGAHNRVMSVAALERQLSEAADGGQSVDLRQYFASLCDHMAGSFISDDQSVALVVSADGSVSPRVSISLGLIVTELVINALKHGFPAGRSGRIEVVYQVQGPNWTLCVTDDGIGMPGDREAVRPGLGTGVIAALARQLQAIVTITPGAPGTSVSIKHMQVALVGDGDSSAASTGNSRRTG